MKELAHDKIIRYRHIFKNSYNRVICIEYKRTKHNIHILHGKIIKCRKSSIMIIINDEEKVDIGFRNILNSTFLDSHPEIKYKLYYKNS